MERNSDGEDGCGVDGGVGLQGKESGQVDLTKTHHRHVGKSQSNF